MRAKATAIGVYFGAEAIAWLASVGVSALAIILLRALGIGSSAKRITMQARYLAIVFLFIVGVEAVNGRFPNLTGTMFPKTWDHPIALLDEEFGLDPAFSAGRFLQQHHALWDFAFLTYNGLLAGSLSWFLCNLVGVSAMGLQRWRNLLSQASPAGSSIC